ncbi:MAG TPA: hypothetical protein PKJ41_08960 [Bryobacteraceae bacterium]|nr:hypothetical protein [Bryobacteraceae bacterium]HPT25738.1 hypothetical protein [Bryobacteraceae bacterium]
MKTFTRRSFLDSVPALAAAAPSPAMPTIRLGPHSISRLIVGGNPVSANSHVSGALSSEMRDYFTAANTKKMLADCERAGINTWQSRADRHIMRLLHEYRQEGGRIQWIAQTASEYGDLKRNLGEASSLRPEGIYHHGSQTDKYWLSGKIDATSEALKAIRQTGAQVGLGTHIPEVVDYVESKGWDFDFYMTCVYNLSRSQEEAEKLAGRPVKGEYFHDPDRERMLERVRRTAKPCLIFKVYAATRHCATPEDRRAALNLAFRYAKPGDAVVIGMFPKHQEQVEENCRLVIEAALSRRAPQTP